MSQTKLHVKSVGQGIDVVMLHGWGVNSAVFNALPDMLPEYRFHFVDLPGFGDSPVINGEIDDWLAAIIDSVPQPAIWIGWSLGGLIASLAAIKYPQYVSRLCTIASSPCFMAREEESWPGIPSSVLAQFASQLQQDLNKTIERFLAIQAMGSQTAKGDIKQLREWVLAKPQAQFPALQQGLSMLANVDIREQTTNIKQPWLRLWGKLDGLVPRKVIQLMPVMENTQDTMLAKASHAPFISHTEEFVTKLEEWLKSTTYQHT
ncbi:BioH [Shewanella piezotolerans WP3]|uniref:Pimeloyl-[acyl-carrier protein] methyl ester esterase n=1 Tax=Shewanella piezotolerans (strain WP3 / JCM 13877) TaxID=225849 RepID=B8CUZ1_SHEPW|nr:pimeloyl-ACP methyl ester esterase BioH [Shewanella piezotolerans]ACJ31467.1 BioH [Shewanella piezotolerans WP3]